MATPAAIAAARSAGYKGTFGGGGYNAFTAGKADAYGRPIQAAPAAPQGPSGAGVVPATAVPMHQYEKAGLQSLANPNYLGGGLMGGAVGMLQEMQADPAAFAAKYTNPQATKYMTQAGEYTAGGAKPITLEEVQGVANPFAGALKNRLTESGEIARAAIKANQGTRGARSFGDTVQGMREGALDKELLSKGSDIDYQTFADATGLVERMRDRGLSAGGQFGNLATAAQGITSNAREGGLGGISALFQAGQTARSNQIENFRNQVEAGKYIRDYNQNVSDQIGNDILAEQEYPLNNLKNVLALLESFKSGTGGATPKANSLETAGGLANILSPIADRIGMSGGEGVDTFLGSINGRDAGSDRL